MWFNQQMCVLQLWGLGKFKILAMADSVSGESLIPGLWMAIFLL